MCWFLRKFPLEQSDLAPMIRGHQITLQLAQTAGLAPLLNDLQSPESRSQMRASPQAYLAARGITLPMGAVVEARELQAGGWEVEVRVVEGLYAYVNGFNNEKGFYRTQGPQRPNVGEGQTAV